MIIKSSKARRRCKRLVCRLLRALSRMPSYG